MAQVEYNAQEDTSSVETALPFNHYCRYYLSTLRCRISSLGKQSARLGLWLELDVFPAAKRAGYEVVSLEVRPEGVIHLGRKEGLDTTPDLRDCQDLCAFLERIGIGRLELATRLESNQIVDVLLFLYTYRRALSSRHDGKESGTGVGQQLLSGHGVHFCCTQMCVRDQVLVVEYSYCTARMSRIVRWFERRHRHFSDHRALFHAAPRYGLLAVAMALVVLLVYVLTDNLNLLIATTLVEAVILFAGVYVFFLGMGSIEYDNEEKAYRLNRAHADLEQYADRIRQDLALARTVQQKLLPDRQGMPLRDRLEWASSFVPATEVGGDYFDVAETGNGKVAMVFADVSGHGVAAALITMILKTTFQAWAEKRQPLTDFVRSANRILCRLTTDGSFVVLVAAVYDDAERRFDYVNCGHAPEPFYLPSDPSRPIVSLTQMGAMLLGVQEEIEVHELTQTLASGDRILLATDGLTEAANSQGSFYGKDRVGEFLQTHRTSHMEDLETSLVEDVSRFADGTEQGDDRTVLAFQVR